MPSRQEMIVFLKDRLVPFDGVLTRTQQVDLTCEIFRYLLDYFVQFQEFFANDLRLVYTVAAKCAEMQKNEIVLKHYPHVQALASELLHKIQRLIQSLDENHTDGG